MTILAAFPVCLICLLGVRCLSLPYLTLLNLDGTRLKPAFQEALALNVCSALPSCPRLQNVSAKYPVLASDSEGEGEEGGHS